MSPPLREPAPTVGARAVPDTEEGLTIRDLTVAYPGKVVLRGVSADIRRGQVVGLIGPNGGGKSTLLMAILGIVPIVRGTVMLFGCPAAAVRARMTYVPQRELVDWDFPVTVREVVMMGRYPGIGRLGRPGRHDHECVDRVLERVGMREHRGTQIGQLSGGQQQRVFIARALAQEADVLLLDEPLGRDRCGDPGSDPRDPRGAATGGQDRAPRDPRPGERVRSLRLPLLPERPTRVLWPLAGDVHRGEPHGDVRGAGDHARAPAGRRPAPRGRACASHTRARATGWRAGAMSVGLHWVMDPLHYEFMRRAFLEVALMGVVTGIIGTYVVLRGLSFLGDALAHAVFPGIVIAFLLGQSLFVGALLFGVLTSTLIAVLTTTRRIKEDSAIGVLFAGAFALGIVLISATRNFARDLASFLFGNVLGVTTEDIWVSAIVGVIVVGLVAVFYRELLITSFDRVGARAMGFPVFWLDFLLLILVSLTIVVSLSAVGNILVLAMLVTPAAAARFLTDRLPVMMGLSAAIGVVSGVVGLLVSYHAGLAAGGMIVLVATGLFGMIWLFAPTPRGDRESGVGGPPGAGG